MGRQYSESVIYISKSRIGKLASGHFTHYSHVIEEVLSCGRGQLFRGFDTDSSGGCQEDMH